MTEQDNALTGWRRILLEWSDIPLRGALAATFIVHGAGKLFGGMDGFAANLDKMGVPAASVMAWVAVIAEFGGGIGMALGLLTRLSALGLMGVMAVAIFNVHWSQGFKMGAMINAAGEARQTGFEWQIALACMALAMFIRGAGPLSVDRLITGYWRRKKEEPAVKS